MQACNFIKKRPQHRFFLVKFAKFLKTSFVTEHLRQLLLTGSALVRLTRRTNLEPYSYIYIYIYTYIYIYIYIHIYIYTHIYIYIFIYIYINYINRQIDRQIDLYYYIFLYDYHHYTTYFTQRRNLYSVQLQILLVIFVVPSSYLPCRSFALVRTTEAANRGAL